MFRASKWWVLASVLVIWFLPVQVQSSDLEAIGNDSEDHVVVDPLKNGSFEQRVAIMRQLRRGGEASVESVPLLISLLSDESEDIRRLASQALMGISKAAEPFVVPLLSAELANENKHIRVGVCSILGWLSREREAVVSELVERARDEDPNVRARAIATIADIGKSGFGAIPAVFEALRNKDGAVYGAAIAAIKKIGSQFPGVVISGVVKALEDSDPSVRRAAIVVTRSFSDSVSPTLPRLISLLDDEDEGVRQEAKVTLMLRIPLMPIPDVIRLLRYGDYEIRKEAVRMLGVVAPTIPSFLVPAVVSGLSKALEDENNDIRRGALVVLGRLGGKAISVVDRIIPLGEDPNSEIRRHAVSALGRIGKGSAKNSQVSPILNTLMSLMNSDKEQMRQEAALSLSLLGILALDVLPEIKKHLDDPVEGVRDAVAVAVLAIQGNFREALKSKNPRVREWTMTMLADRPRDTLHVVSTVIRILNSQKEDEGIRKFAAIALANAMKVSDEKTTQKIAYSLIKVVKNDGQWAHGRLIESLGTLSRKAGQKLTQKIVKAFMKELNTPDDQQRQKLLQELGRTGKVVDSKISLEIVDSILDRLKTDGDLSVVPSLQMVSQNIDPEVRQNISAKLGQLLKGGDEKQRLWAAQALKTMGPLAEGAMKDLEIALLNESDETTLSVVVEAIKRIEDS